jgi:hypothetical protein
MNDFVWKGKDPEGRVRSERVTAENAQAAKAELLARGWLDVLLVREEISSRGSCRSPNPTSARRSRPRATTTGRAIISAGRKVPGGRPGGRAARGLPRDDVMIPLNLLHVDRRRGPDAPACCSSGVTGSMPSQQKIASR